VRKGKCGMVAIASEDSTARKDRGLRLRSLNKFGLDISP
jgi:hypothetical protein